MKQKHRKVIYFVLAGIVAFVFIPIWLIATISTSISNKVIDVCNNLQYLLRIHDEDAPKTDKK